MNTQIKIEAANAHEVLSNSFHVVTLAVVALFSLAQTIQFLTSAV